MLNDKVVLVIGGAGLLGRKIVERCVVMGAKVVVADQNQSTARKVAEAFPKSSDSALIDITDKTSVTDAFRFAEQRWGRLDAVVNTAYPRNSNYGRDFKSVEYGDFCENLSLHLGGYFLVSQQAALYFSEHGGGTVLNMASIYGVVAPRFDVYNGLSMTMPVEYAAIKSALIHLTKYIAKYMSGTNVRINCISLGGILDKQPESFVEKYKSYALNKGMLDPDDVLGAICFLLSNDSKYVNGQNLIVDDGWTL